jgi:VanZ family protein
MRRKVLLPWLPAVLVMVIIFCFSSIPSRDMPDLGLLDLVVQKAGHVIGYGFLALAYWLGLRFDRRRWWLALLLAVLYGVSDEVHQSFVPGRHPGWMDVLVYDGGGAAVALGLAGWVRAKRAASTKNE